MSCQSDGECCTPVTLPRVQQHRARDRHYPETTVKVKARFYAPESIKGPRHGQGDGAFRKGEGVADQPTGSVKKESTESVLKRLGKPDLLQVQAWRAMSPARRLEIAFQLYQFALEVVRVTERRRYTHLSADELAWRVTRRMQGDPTLGR